MKTQHSMMLLLFACGPAPRVPDQPEPPSPKLESPPQRPSRLKHELWPEPGRVLNASIARGVELPRDGEWAGPGDDVCANAPSARKRLDEPRLRLELTRAGAAFTLLLSFTYATEELTFADATARGRCTPFVGSATFGAFAAESIQGTMAEEDALWLEALAQPIVVDPRDRESFEYLRAMMDYLNTQTLPNEWARTTRSQRAPAQAVLPFENLRDFDALNAWIQLERRLTDEGTPSGLRESPDNALTWVCAE